MATSLPMHPLAIYLKRRGITQARFSEISGVSEPVISRVLNGVRARFSVESALAIEAATNGRVGLRALLGESAARGNRRSMARGTNGVRR